MNQPTTELHKPTKLPPPAPRELVVIVEPKAQFRVRRNNKITGVGVAPLVKLIASEGVIIQPLYGVSEEWLRRRTAHMKEVCMGVGQRLDLSIFYKITAPDEKFEDLAVKLRALDVIQAAYIKPGAELTIVNNNIAFESGLLPGLATGDFTSKQIYLKDASEGGVGVDCAWAKEGGRGQQIKIIDVEGAWRFSHEDLIQNSCGQIGGGSTPDLGWRNHGTAVLGVLGGDINNLGVTGICPEAIVGGSSIFGTSITPDAPIWSAAAAIRLAADNLNRGDIILIEHHLPGRKADFQPRDDQFGYLPIEWWPCNLAAIQYATGRGIIVVEAAGNGKQNLDNIIYEDDPDAPFGPFPDWWRNPFPRNPIDSGAIVVGAGIPPGPSKPDRSRLRESNYGSMVDAQGWGDNVVSCGYGGLSENDADEDRWYTSRFNGTSSAAAMVAGVVGCIQGASKAVNNVLDPATVRAALRDDNLNSPQTDGPFGTASVVRIGPRPNLCKLMDHLIPTPGIIQKLKSDLRRLLIS